MINIVALLERGGYHYYVNVCLKKEYSDLIYLDLYFLESAEKQSLQFPKLNLILRFNNEPDDLFEEEVQEFKSEILLKSNALSKETNMKFSKKSYLSNPNYVLPIGCHKLFKKYSNLFLMTFYFSILQYLILTNLNCNHFPPKNNDFSFNPTKNFYREGLA
jgi:hypothetical protein